MSKVKSRIERTDREDLAKANMRHRAEMEFGVPAEAYRSDPTQRSTRSGAVLLRVLISTLVAGAVLAAIVLTKGATLVAVTCAVVVFALVFASVHVALGWERFVVLRMGKYNRLGGPGFFMTIPFIEYCTLRVDQRTRVTPFGAEETLAADMIPLDVDAVLLWVIWDPEKACTEVEDVNFAVSLEAQTALRDAIGRAAASEVVARRNQLDQEIQNAIEEKVNDWGVTILSVKIRNIVIPRALQETMAMSAQAERRRDARLMLIESETTIAELLHEASAVYKDDPTAYELRKMHLVHEGIIDDASAMVVPSAYTQGFVTEGKELKK